MPHAELRDFTINALFYDPRTNEVLDFVGGVPDLEVRPVSIPHFFPIRFLVWTFSSRRLAFIPQIISSSGQPSSRRRVERRRKPLYRFASVL